MIRRLMRGSDWRREALRTNLWLVPAVEVVAAVGLFAVTYALDRAAFAGDFRLPGWLLSGSPDAARQILTAIAAAIITVVGVVFSIVIVALTLTSTQFGPRMLRNFIRDRGTQVTLGTFVATFVYAVLALGAIGQGGPAFVPHISITVTLALMVADLAVLIYFLHHITTQIQLPQVIASIASDLAGAIELQAGDGAAESGNAAARLVAGLHGPGGEVAAPRSGYLQYIQHRRLVRLAAELQRGDPPALSARPLPGAGASLRDGVAGRRRRSGRPRAGPRTRHRAVPDPGSGCLVWGRPAGRDRDPRAVAGGQ